MNAKNLLLSSLLATSIIGFSKTFTITASGLSFSPSVITVSSTDTIVFAKMSGHNAVEVSKTTWDANGTTALNGGFSVPFGGGTVLAKDLTAGTHYYVCTPHAGFGMKAQITVETITGIAEETGANNVIAFPNPTKNTVNVNTSSLVGKAFSVSNQLGEAVINGTVNSENTLIDLSALATGVYFFKSEGATVKIIKE